jgi:hypothetical protein
MRLKRLSIITAVLISISLAPMATADERINFCGYPDFLEKLQAVGVTVVALVDQEGADDAIQKAVAEMTEKRLAEAGIRMIDADTIRDATGTQGVLVITVVSKKTPENLQAACLSFLLLSPYRAWEGGRCDIPLVMWGAVPDTVHLLKPAEFQAGIVSLAAKEIDRLVEAYKTSQPKSE